MLHEASQHARRSVSLRLDRAAPNVRIKNATLGSVPAAKSDRDLRVRGVQLRKPRIRQKPRRLAARFHPLPNHDKID